jgi:hypothetical protein
MTEFQPGEYTTRGGCQAVVEFVVPVPRVDTTYTRVGRICGNEGWCFMVWTSTGRVYVDEKHKHDLIPPAEVTYRRLPCSEHVRISGSGYPERSYDGAAPENCPNCRVERIERVGGVVTKVELVEAKEVTKVELVEAKEVTKVELVEAKEVTKVELVEAKEVADE